MSDSPICDSVPKFKTSYFWTEDRVLKLRRLISTDRLSAFAAAAELGCTKNMVVGKCDRMRIALRPRSKATKPRAQIDKDYLARKKQAREITHIESLYPAAWAAPTSNPFPDPGCCLFGCGNPGEPKFHFCGKPNEPGKSYCAAHCARTYINRADPDQLAAV